MSELAGPYRGVNLVLQIDDGSGYVTVGVVDGNDIRLGYEGGPEACFGTRTKSHSAGSKKVSFTITRWYYTDSGQQDLLMDLFENETSFSLKGYLIDKDGNTISNTAIIISGCKLYAWGPTSGGADDLMGEEASGFATGWDLSGLVNTP